MSFVSPPIHVFCNGVIPHNNINKKERILELNWHNGPKNSNNVKLLLPDFIRSVYHLPEHICDLLEISSYIYCADRLSKRGDINLIEYHSWARHFIFHIAVRKPSFWNQKEVIKKLSEALVWMTGDRLFEFQFYNEYTTPPADLFDSEEFSLPNISDVKVVLFSGGIDSLAGTVDLLEKTNSFIFLVSHQSGQPSTKKTQDNLAEALNKLYPNRIGHYRFQTHLRGVRASEESQRTRAFLYSSIGYALSISLKQKQFYVFENGPIALNFSKRQSIINARASRTAHPQTIFKIKDFLSTINGSDFKIETPFLWKTKSEIFEILKESKSAKLISSSVSCSKTYKNLGSASQCGICPQCIDRRFAAYCSKCEDFDNSTYNFDFLTDNVEEGEDRTILIDYLRQAIHFYTWNIDHFYKEKGSEIFDIIDYIGENSDSSSINRIFDLCKRHGKDVLETIKTMRNIQEKLISYLPENSLFQIINERKYLSQPVELLSDMIAMILSKSIPIIFQKNFPKDENDFNDKIEGILKTHMEEIEREHPSLPFALSKSIPDHSSLNYPLYIESKYLRGKTKPSVINKSICEDLVKYPDDKFILFIIYDPTRKIKNDQKFRIDIESKRLCKVNIIR